MKLPPKVLVRWSQAGEFSTDVRPKPVPELDDCSGGVVHRRIDPIACRCVTGSAWQFSDQTRLWWRAASQFGAVFSSADPFRRYTGPLGRGYRNAGHLDLPVKRQAPSVK